MGDGDEQILSEIERMRARNNVLHVGIVRIALEARPAETKALLREIRENDIAISEWTGELAR